MRTTRPHLVHAVAFALTFPRQCGHLAANAASPCRAIRATQTTATVGTKSHMASVPWSLSMAQLSAQTSAPAATQVATIFLVRLMSAAVLCDFESDHVLSDVVLGAHDEVLWEEHAEHGVARVRCVADIGVLELRLGVLEVEPGDVGTGRFRMAACRHGDAGSSRAPIWQPSGIAFASCAPFAGSVRNSSRTTRVCIAPWSVPLNVASGTSA